MIPRHSVNSSSIRASTRRGTAVVEFILLLMPLVSVALFALALWHVRARAQFQRLGAHADAFHAALDPDHTSSALLRPWLALKRTSTQAFPSFPVDLRVDRLPNSNALGHADERIHAAAGVFGRLPSVHVERVAATARPAWTCRSFPFDATQSISEQSIVRDWFRRSLRVTTGGVERALRLDTRLLW